MRIERAVRFGLAATVGVGIISMTTGWLVWTQYSTRISGTEPAWVLIMGIGLAGLAADLMLLFALIGEYVDRELEARGLARLEE